MPRTPAQKQATDRYRARNGRVQVNIELTPEICRRWQAYAGSRGMSLTAMARECVARCMAEDSLAAEAGAQRQALPRPHMPPWGRAPCAPRAWTGASRAWRAWTEPACQMTKPVL